MTIVKLDMKLQIGIDFVDAVSGIKKSHGEVEVSSSEKRRSKFKWESTLNCTDSERALRRAAKEEGFHVSFLLSQAK